MRIFVSEYICCGAWPDDEPLPALLLREGKAMLFAIAADFARIPGTSVVTTHDARLGCIEIPGVESIPVERSSDEPGLFRKLAADCDRTFVIAPEFDGILAERAHWLDDVAARSLGASAHAIELCSDKLQLADHLRHAGLSTIETRLLECMDDAADLSFPVVLKPRDGAGSQNVFLARNEIECERACKELFPDDESAQVIVQPYVEGSALSVGVIVRQPSNQNDILPVAEQHLNGDGRFGYLGGCIPARAASGHSVERLAGDALDSIPGLAGYVGIDLILPTGKIDEPIIVEINPRLTASYLGYRELTRETLAERLLYPDRAFDDIEWKSGSVTFLADGSRCNAGAE